MAMAPQLGPLAGGNAVTLTGIGLSDATEVHFGAVRAGHFTAGSDTRIEVTAPAGSAGNAPVTVTTAGGTSDAVSYAYLPPPVVTTVSPRTRPKSGGALVTLTGTGLGRTVAVLCGAVPAAFTAVDDHRVAVVVPPGPAGPVPVIAVTPGGSSTAVTCTRALPPHL
ncbi:IPT/TIG domain-containing protein [Streptomyces inhibens]|uniref:IPT/TIG domain-containing protein n=1 Tax=Streptomyces inhibens TaxID=2293571 RepID=UPI00247A85B4|nr:IPT/TIG domain-containing protein [Streptomyces inhibens]